MEKNAVLCPDRLACTAFCTPVVLVKKWAADSEVPPGWLMTSPSLLPVISMVSRPVSVPPVNGKNPVPPPV